MPFEKIREPYGVRQSYDKDYVLKGSVELGERGCEEIWKAVGVNASALTESNFCTVKSKTGDKLANANCEAGVAKARASASANPTQASAEAVASGPNAKAGATFGLLGIQAGASLAQVGASAGAGLKELGAKAGAEAVIAKVGIEIPYIVEAHVQGPGASANAGISVQYTGVSVGASLAEAQAGPFAVRAGVKFGVGVKNFIPQIDAGPVTVPCCIQ